jgi:hypothetical protein
MQFVYDCPFVVALKVVNMKAGETASEVEKKILKAVIAIDFGLPLAEEVEVGAVDDDDLHRRLVAVIRNELDAHEAYFVQRDIVLFEFLVGYVDRIGGRIHKVGEDVFAHIFINEVIDIIVNINFGTRGDDYIELLYKFIHADTDRKSVV